jgi:hypothetical protein
MAISLDRRETAVAATNLKADFRLVKAATLLDGAGTLP